MAKVSAKFSAVKQTRWYEYLVRFVFGGLITVMAGYIAKHYGPVIGGLFLAFPSIFPASVILVQTHEEKQKKEVGVHGKELSRKVAGVAAAGAALGSFGLFAFGVVLWQLSPRWAPWLVLLAALVDQEIYSFLIHSTHGEEQSRRAVERSVRERGWVV